MTVKFSAHVAQRAWRGYDDPGLPVGQWISQGAVAGDATGGEMIVSFIFRAGGAAASGRYYNLEQIEAFHSDPLNQDMALQATNWDELGDVGLINRQWQAFLKGNSNFVAAMSTSEQFPLPIFLGLTSPVPALSCELEISTNNANMESLVVTGQGYIWEPRSVLAEGGLRRPVDSLYGNGRQ